MLQNAIVLSNSSSAWLGRWFYLRSSGPGLEFGGKISFLHSEAFVANFLSDQFFDPVNILFFLRLHFVPELLQVIAPLRIGDVLVIAPNRIESAAQVVNEIVVVIRATTRFPIWINSFSAARVIVILLFPKQLLFFSRNSCYSNNRKRDLAVASACHKAGGCGTASLMRSSNPMSRSDHTGFRSTAKYWGASNYKDSDDLSD